MAFLDHEGGAEFPYTREDVFDALIKAIATISGLTVHSADKLSGRVLVKAAVSLMSWGENIPISVVEMSPGRTRVSITSTPKTGVLLGGAFDLGKNRRNIEQVLDALSQVLSRKPPFHQGSVEAKGNDPLITQLERLGNLKAQGVLTEEEFQTQKAKLLGHNVTAATSPLPQPPAPPKPQPQQEEDNRTVPCPLCEKPLRLTTLKVGRNLCPYCGGEFIGD
jgi:hypothetical protein